MSASGGGPPTASGSAGVAVADTDRDVFIDALPASMRIEASARWATHGARLASIWRRLYAGRSDTGQLVALLQGVAAAAAARPEDLRALDRARSAAPGWFQTQGMIGYSTYVDRFADDLRGVAARVPYLQSLGVRYLHLLPFQAARQGDNDGGFAVRDYDAVEPTLGSAADLDALTARLRAADISLCADLVLNHTADDHAWALAARSGDACYRAFYHVFPDRELPDRHARTLREVFPLTAPGNFTHVDGLGWVWTTFYPYQWDLDWSNPDVFCAMALTLLRMANRGIEILRLDSAAYLWKREGTDSRNQPETHAILQMLRALVALAAPAVLLKAEAIVPSRELPPYFGDGAAAGRECHLAYHSTLMAATWAALAEQRGDILTHVVGQTPALPQHCAWVNYVRCHDDIGWQVLATEAAGYDPPAPFSLARIARFYAGEEPGSYARGRNFQHLSAGVAYGSNGMAAALAGIDAALANADAPALRLAERRLLLLYGIAMAAAGMPLIYMGDELALGNDVAFADDPGHTAEGRWLQRPRMDWMLAASAESETGGAADATVASRVLAGLRRLITVRRATPALAADVPMRAIKADSRALFSLARGDDFVALFNLGATPVAVPALPGCAGRSAHDLLADTTATWPTTLAPYDMRWWSVR